MRLILCIYLILIASDCVASQFQFDIMNTNFDALALHNHSCSLGVGSQIIIYCEDGYTAVETLSNFIYINSKQSANQSYYFSQAVSNANIRENSITLVQEQALYIY
jgi:hypothetical protein